MPGRKLTKTADSSVVMGADSFVTYTEPTNAEMREFRQKVGDFSRRANDIEKQYGADSDELNGVLDEAETYQANFLAQFIQDWNWVADEDGEIPLLKPKDNPIAFKDLLPTEMKWLGELFNVSIEKKLKSRR